LAKPGAGGKFWGSVSCGPVAHAPTQPSVGGVGSSSLVGIFTPGGVGGSSVASLTPSVPAAPEIEGPAIADAGFGDTAGAIGAAGAALAPVPAAGTSPAGAGAASAPQAHEANAQDASSATSSRARDAARWRRMKCGACARVAAAEAAVDEDCIMIQVGPGGSEPFNLGDDSSGIVFNRLRLALLLRL
jgi:hypothetical protein